MNIKITLVRLKENKEPVAVFEKIDCIVSLGAYIDEVTDPARCEYCDYELKEDFKLLFFDNCDEFNENEDVQFAALDSLSLGFDFKVKVIQAFLDKKNDWAEFPENFDCLSDSLEFDERFWSPVSSEDIF